MGKEDDHQKSCSYNATSLQIGNWKLELNDARCSGVNRIVAKFMFKKGKKMVWELGGKYYKKIEIEFQRIAAIRFLHLDGAQGAFQILLKDRPEFYKEVNPVANKHTKYEICEDFTLGRQASLHRVHSLIFPLERLKKLQMSLIRADSSLYQELNKVEAFKEDEGALLFEDPSSSMIHFQKRQRAFPAAAEDQPPPKFRRSYYQPRPPPHLPPAAYQYPTTTTAAAAAHPPAPAPAEAAMRSYLEQVMINSNSNWLIPCTSAYPANFGLQSSSFHPPPTTSQLQTYEALPPPPGNNGFITMPPPPAVLTIEEIFQDHHHNQQQQQQEDATTYNPDQLPSCPHSFPPSFSHPECSWGVSPDQLPPISTTQQRPGGHHQLITNYNNSNGFPTAASAGLTREEKSQLMLEEDIGTAADHTQQAADDKATEDWISYLPPPTTTQPPPAAPSYSSQQQLTNINSSNGFPTASSDLSFEEICQMIEEEGIPTVADQTQQAADEPIADWISSYPPDTTHDQPPAAASYSSQQQLTNTNSSNGFPTIALSPGHEFTNEEIFQDHHLQQIDGSSPQNGAQQDQPVDWISYFFH